MRHSGKRDERLPLVAEAQREGPEEPVLRDGARSIARCHRTDCTGLLFCPAWELRDAPLRLDPQPKFSTPLPKSEKYGKTSVIRGHGLADDPAGSVANASFLAPFCID